MKERRRFSSSAAPTEPGRSDAPISATERGSRNRATADVAATRSRSSNAASASAPSAVGSSTSTTPDRARTEAGNPLSRKTSTIRRLSARTSATNCGMPARRGDIGDEAQQDGAEPVALPRVGDGEGDLGALGVDPHVHRVRDDPAVGADRDEPHPVAPVHLGRVPGRRAQVDPERQEAERPRVRRQGRRRSRAARPRPPARGAGRAAWSRRAGRPHGSWRGASAVTRSGARPPILLGTRASGASVESHLERRGDSRLQALRDAVGSGHERHRQRAFLDPHAAVRADPLPHRPQPGGSRGRPPGGRPGRARARRSTS